MSDEEVVARFKNLLRTGQWTPQDRMDLRKSVADWEKEYAKILADSTALFQKDTKRGKPFIQRTVDGLTDLIGSAALTRLAFEGEDGYTDMYDLCQKHIDQLVEWKRQLEGLIGIGTN